MISQCEIEKLIANGEVSISYAFSKFGGSPPVFLNGEQFVSVQDANNPATKMFQQNFFADRLLLTLGPIVMSHEIRRPIKGRSLYKERPSYFDLRQSENSIIVEPHETLSISTNERIILGGRTGAYILPRLRNVDSGILYTPSYIDPFWDGILQGVLVNATDRRQRLSLCEGIAICRFYPVIGEISADVQQRFPAKSHHFGQTWAKILLEESDPFPRRKLPLPVTSTEARLDAIKDFFTSRWKELVALGYAGGIFGLAYWLGTLNTDIKRLLAIEPSFNQIKQIELPALGQDFDTLSKRTAVSGTVVVAIPEGKKRTLYSFQVSRPANATVTVWAEPLERLAAPMSVSARVDPSPSDSSKVTITLDVAVPQESTESRVVIKWMLVS
jgi:deoxycytidine triphosphate deaminase